MAPTGDMVNLSTTVDPHKNREVPLCLQDVYNRGLENWRRLVGYGVKGPPPSIRPSMAQYTGFLEVFFNCKSLYVDIKLMAPHDIRTNRSFKLQGITTDKQGRIRQEPRECYGTPTLMEYLECFNVYACCCIMSGALVPPRLDAWIEKQTMYNAKYPQCWPFQYQLADRYCHGMLPGTAPHRSAQVRQQGLYIQHEPWMVAIHHRRGFAVQA